MKPEEIRIGGCYSNGDFGRRWCVWQVVDITSSDGDAPDETVRFRIVVGENRRKYRILNRTEFANQVRYEVTLVENTWQRLDE
jgi:hypothetical protein